MTTITINNPVIEEKYTKEEIARLFVYFMETNLKENINLYEVSVSDIPKEVLESYKNIDNMNFIKR